MSASLMVKIITTSNFEGELLRVWIIIKISFKRGKKIFLTPTQHLGQQVAIYSAKFKERKLHSIITLKIK